MRLECSGQLDTERESAESAGTRRPRSTRRNTVIWNVEQVPRGIHIHRVRTPIVCDWDVDMFPRALTARRSALEFGRIRIRPRLGEVKMTMMPPATDRVQSVVQCLRCLLQHARLRSHRHLTVA